MSMITEQVEYLIKLSNKHPFESNIPTLQRACEEAAGTIEQLAAKVRAENNESQPCEDAIGRQAAIKAFQMFREYESNRSNKEWVERIETVLNQLPPVTPQSKMGKWIEERTYMSCPHCHDIWHYKENQAERFKCCPTCGERLK